MFFGLLEIKIKYNNDMTPQVIYSLSITRYLLSTGSGKGKTGYFLQPSGSITAGAQKCKIFTLWEGPFFCLLKLKGWYNHLPNTLDPALYLPTGYRLYCIRV